MRVNIANVLVDNITTAETIQKIDEFVVSGTTHYIVTTYSEFIVFADRDGKYLEILNKADLSLPDGVGMLWAAKYLSLKASNNLQALWQLKYTLLAILLAPNYIRSIIKQKVSGSKLIWDMAKLASQKNYSLALVGGPDSVAAQSAYELKKKFPNLRVNLTLSGQPFDQVVVEQIAKSNSDILCIAYQPPKQEIWIAENLSKLNVKVAIGLGGTFDYLAGHKSQAPNWMVNLGLEWLWRLITQPYRFKRMWNALPVFIWTVYKFKLQQIHGKSQS